LWRRASDIETVEEPPHNNQIPIQLPFSQLLELCKLMYRDMTTARIIQHANPDERIQAKKQFSREEQLD
jgi:hypothetical protein